MPSRNKKEAIVLLNMGGPNNLDEVKVFLKNMFNDKNILRFKRPWMRSLLGSFITTLRGKEARKNYAALGGHSPIVGHTQDIVSALQERVKDVEVHYAMRYTPPFASEVIEKLKESGTEHVYLLPMYPQYSTTTTLSSLEDFYESAKRLELDAKIYDVWRYFDNSALNNSIIDRVEESLNGDNARDFELIFSAHGLPKSIIEAGDSYEKEMEQHVEILKSMLKYRGLEFRNIHLAYQSRLGPVEWLNPSLPQMLERMNNEHVIIYPISFTVDNSETDFELSIEYAEVAKELGISDYRVSRCPNAHPQFINALEELYKKLKISQ